MFIKTHADGTWKYHQEENRPSVTRAIPMPTATQLNTSDDLCKKAMDNHADGYVLQPKNTKPPAGTSIRLTEHDHKALFPVGAPGWRK